jgi:uncharacterized protein YkwD
MYGGGQTIYATMANATMCTLVVTLTSCIAGTLGGCAARQPGADSLTSEPLPAASVSPEMGTQVAAESQDFAAPNAGIDDFCTQTDTETLTREFAMTPDILDLVNRARSVGRKCGDTFFSPASPLTWDNRLAAAALAHARDMADNDYYSHCGRKGKLKPTDTEECYGMPRAWDRAKAAGYPIPFVGENIAMGQTTTRKVLCDWLKSAGHCANIMNPKYEEVGVAFARGWNTQSKYTPDSPFGKTFLWAMSLGSRTTGNTGSTGVTTAEYERCDKEVSDTKKNQACRSMVDVCMATSAAAARVTLNTDSGPITLDNREACLNIAIKLSQLHYMLK